MSSKVKGKVSKILKSKFGYAIMLDDSKFYYNTNYDPKVGEGDVVGIMFERKGDNRGNIKKVKLLTDGGSPKGFQGGNRGGGGGGGSSNNDPARQQSIVYQSVLKTVPGLAALIIEHGGIKIPKTKPDAARIVIEELIDELAIKYTKIALDPREALKGLKDAKGESEANDDDDWDDDDVDGDWDGSSDDGWEE